MTRHDPSILPAKSLSEGTIVLSLKKVDIQITSIGCRWIVNFSSIFHLFRLDFA
jgi:hypothetical protein